MVRLFLLKNTRNWQRLTRPINCLIYVVTCILVKVLKKILFGLEPYEISTLFEQRQAMLQSIKEGVVAVDDRGEVTLINDAAQELLNYRKSQDDEKLSTLSHSWSQVVDIAPISASSRISPVSEAKIT